MKKRKILYISGTRADYGLMRETLFQINRHPNLSIEIVVAGMHLMEEFGKTVDEIKKDGFKIHQINAIYEDDNKASMANFIGKFIQLLNKKIKKIKPDMILLLGDRGEMLAGAVVGVYLTIPVAHIGGGEITSTVDEIVRHAITKLSHIHFSTTKNSAERIKKMGEDSFRVFVVGAPGLDSILSNKLISKKEISKKYNLDLNKPILLVIQHPVTAEINKAVSQIKETMEAIKELGFQSIVIYSNADAGGRKMVKIIEQYQKYPFIKIYKNIPHKDYLRLMGFVGALVGNSSSGIIEAPSFHLPVVNIGTRQEGRERAENVINVGYAKKEIKKAILKSICNKKFGEKLKNIKNPYGDGKTSKRIVNILSKVKIDKKLLQKKMTY